MASAYYRNLSSGGSTGRFTISFWLKRGDNDKGIHRIFWLGSSSGGDGYLTMRFNDDDGGGHLRVQGGAGSGTSLDLKSTKKLMDSQWYHFVIRLEMGNSNANKVRVYMNGEQLTWYAQTNFTAGSLASTFWTGTNARFTINENPDGSQSGDHHYSEFYFVDGQDLLATDFAYTDSNGKWRSKSPAAIRSTINSGSNTFGTNGFYLSFQDATSTTTLGHDYQTADRSGTTNDFTLTGTLSGGTGARIKAGPDNDFPIMSEMTRDYSGWDFDDGGLKITTSDTGTLQDIVLASKHLPKTGKWWWEAQLQELTTTGAGGTSNFFGFTTTGEREYVRWQYSHNGSANGNSIFGSPGGTLATISSGGSTGYPSANDWYGFGADMDNGTFLVHRNGTQIGSVSYNFNANSVQNFIPFFRNDEGVSGRGSRSLFNFGQGHTVTGNSGNGYADGNGHGKFQYAVPSGYLAICDANIPNVTITPSEHCNLVYYDGDGNDNRAINLGFQPDLILSKRSQNTASWYWIDSVRGNAHPLTSHNTAQQGTESNQVKSFTSTGITIGTDANINGSGTNQYLTVGWKGGGTAVTNTAGSINSTVSANPTAGFSVVKYTTQAGTYSVGHGLGKKPDLILIKGNYDSNDATNTYNWDVYTPDNSDTGGAGYRLRLNTADQRQTTAAPFSIEPDADKWTQNNNAWYANGVKNIAYCFTGIEGYSQFGYYNGRDNSHVFIHTGFKPLFVVCKPYLNGSVSTGWRWFDKVQLPNNNQGTDYALYLNSSGNRVIQNGVDLHSNGFSVYGESDDNLNSSGVIYFYMAFAELPAEYARGTG